MARVAMIGAGSVQFCLMLVKDIINYGSLEDAEICLMDISEDRLNMTYNVLQKLKQQESLRCVFSTTTDRKKALRDADFVISMIQVGGLDAYKLDVNIPLKYKVDQCVGDTLGPGGLFRGLRHIPALLEIVRDMQDLCPNAIFMNYANPMAICSWAVQKVYPNIMSVGLCHGVQHTTCMLSWWLGLNPAEVDVLTAGINHMAWFIKIEHKGKDLYPQIWKKLETEGPIQGENYRFEMMKAAGYFMTESSGHLSEYLPYFRNREDIKAKFNTAGFGGETAAYLNSCISGLEEYKKEMTAMANGEKQVPFTKGQKSVEYASSIMNAKLTGEICKIAGNVLNHGFVSNLPDGSCVEIPVYVDRLGLHPTYVGALPPQCAALCRSNIAMQELAVIAGIEGDKSAAYHSCLLDPLTAAVLAPSEIKDMVNELFEAESQWLPQFKK